MIMQLETPLKSIPTTLFNINPVLLRELTSFLELFAEPIKEVEIEKRSTSHKLLLWNFELLNHCEVISRDSQSWAKNW